MNKSAKWFTEEDNYACVNNEIDDSYYREERREKRGEKGEKFTITVGENKIETTNFKTLIKVVKVLLSKNKKIEIVKEVIK